MGSMVAFSISSKENFIKELGEAAQASSIPFLRLAFTRDARVLLFA
jgi:hypothetical protein